MYILGIDFGSKYLKAALCVRDYQTSEISVKKTVKIPHRASRQGTMIDLVKAKEVFGQMLEKIRDGINESIDEYVINVSGENVGSYSGTSTIPLWKQENEERRVRITRSHVNEVLKAAKMTAYNKDDKVELHSIPQEFQIDDQPATLNPIDMSGIKLKSTVYVIQTDKSHRENICSIFDSFGIKNYRIVFSPLATAEAVIDEDDKEAGVIVISLGDQTTELTVYLNGILRMSKMIPFGSNYITKDLKILLKTDYPTANRIKKTVATAFPGEADPEKMIQVENSSSQKTEFSEEYIAKITEARMKEIFEFVTREIYKGSYQRMIHSPVIITGPASCLRGTEKLFSEMNNSKTTCGKAMDIRSEKEELTPDFFTAAGLVKYAVVNDIFSDRDEAEEGGFVNRIKQFVADLF
ncbi:MAG TPA: cell division protein FtsA [Clostridiales bacterium]|nr:cell division protein FtsA [Clostridiales bacterium]